MADVIPCDKCKYNYIKKIKKNPVDVETKMRLVQWLLRIHNEVNISNGKEALSMKDFIKKYRELYTIDEDNQISNNNDYIKIDKKYLNYAIIFVILIIIYTFFKKK